MAKANTKKRFNLFGKSFRLWQLGLIVIAVLFVGFMTYESYLDAKDREKFDEIEYTIDTLTSRLEDEFGISGEYDNYCYESSEKFTTGPTICVYQKKYATPDDNMYESILSFVAQQNDLIKKYSEFRPGILNLTPSSGDYSCSVRQGSTVSSDSFLIECSTEARGSYYEFRD